MPFGRNMIVSVVPPVCGYAFSFVGFIEGLDDVLIEGGTVGYFGGAPVSNVGVIVVRFATIKLPAMTVVGTVVVGDKVVGVINGLLLGDPLGVAIVGPAVGPGVAVGLDVGAVVGIRVVGLFVGLTVGESLGVTDVGSVVGRPGVAVGLDAGVAVGLKVVGALDGLPVGDSLGAAVVGSAVGFPGVTVGLDVGLADGSSVCCDGAGVAAVGDTVNGAWVGVAVGSFVGEAVVGTAVGRPGVMVGPKVVGFRVEGARVGESVGPSVLGTGVVGLAVGSPGSTVGPRVGLEVGAAVGVPVGQAVAGPELGIPTSTGRSFGVGASVGFASGFSLSISFVGISTVGVAVGVPCCTVGDGGVGLKFEGLSDGCEASPNKDSSWGLNMVGAAVESSSPEDALKDKGGNAMPPFALVVGL